MSYEDGEDSSEDGAMRQSGSTDERSDEAAVQAQDCATEDGPMLEGPEEELPSPDSGPVAFVKMLVRLVSSLVIWSIFFAANLGIQMLIGRFIGSGPTYAGGTLIIGHLLLVMLIVTSTIELILVWALMDAGSGKKESSDAHRSDG